MNPEDPPPELEVIRDHRRQWRSCLYVYPVISRRSKGLSIGVNLNPDKRCTFSCLYCQVDRRVRRGLSEVRLDVLREELHIALAEAIAGRIWLEPRFAATPADLRRINDIALSGDGEPTCLEDFDRAVAVTAEVKDQAKRPDVKIVVITNSSLLDQPPFQRALPVLDANNGEIWAKLDAGSEERFRRINQPPANVTLARILENIKLVARGRPVVIQTLLFRLDGAGPPPQEITAYCRRLREILQGGGRIKLVQLHTIARSPASPAASALPQAELADIARQVREALGEVPVEIYPGTNVPPQAE